MIKYKVGDVGVMRDDLEAECYRDEGHGSYPLLWKRENLYIARTSYYGISADSKDRDVIRLLDPWDERVPKKNRQNRFVVMQSNKDRYRVVDMMNNRFLKLEKLSVAKEICDALNQDHGRAATVTLGWNLPKQTKLNFSAKEESMNHESFKRWTFVSPPSITTGLIEVHGWLVAGVKPHDDRGSIKLYRKDHAIDCMSIEQVRDLIATLEHVCKELENG